MDVKVFNESGHGYWLEGFGCIRAGGGFNDANTGHAIVIKNDRSESDQMDVMGCDLYNQTITGEVACALTANMDVAGHTGPKVLICLNDQDGSVMDVSDKAMTLRAQDHGHQPIICFEPGIVKREGGASRFVADKCGTLRANMGDNQPVICLQANGIDRADTAGCNGCGWSEGGVSYTLNTIDRHAVCFAVENHPNDSRVKIDESGIVQTLSSRMGTGGGQHTTRLDEEKR